MDTADRLKEILAQLSERVKVITDAYSKSQATETKARLKQFLKYVCLRMLEIATTYAHTFHRLLVAEAQVLERLRNKRSWKKVLQSENDKDSLESSLEKLNDKADTFKVSIPSFVVFITH